MRLLTGAYGAEMDGVGEGIGELHAGAADQSLAGSALAFAGVVARTDGSPSWVARHPTLDVIYAALESAGAVQAFRRTGESRYERLGPAIPAGEAVCHISVAPDGVWLMATCWGDGRVVRMTLDATGRPSRPSLAPAPVDPYAGSGMSVSTAVAEAADVSLEAAARALRDAAGEEYAHLIPHLGEPEAPLAPELETPVLERTPHAHQSILLPGGAVATTDMGFDLVRFWRPSGDGLRAAGEVVLPRGSGPRHGVWHPSGHLYVVAELSREVFVLAPDASGAWRLVGGVQLAGTLDGDTAAELAASSDGSFLVAGVRGSNTLATVRVAGAGEQLQFVALADSGVDWPRHHVVSRDTVLVAGQRSDEVAAVSLDLRTGIAGRVRSRVAVPSPTCLMPIR